MKETIELTLSQRIIAASSGALVTSLLVTPFDVVKTRMQLQSSESSLPTASREYKNGLMEHLIPSDLSKRKLRLSSRSCKAVCSFRNLKHSTFYRKKPGIACLTSYSKVRCSICVTSDLFKIQHTIPTPTQVNPHFHKHLKGTFHGLRTILRNEGIPGLYVGLKPTLFMAVPATVLYFSSYDYLHIFLRDKADLGDHQSALLAGTLGRTFAASVIAPIELVRTRLQARNSQVSRSLLIYASTIIRTEGFGGVFKGLTPMLLRDVPFSGVYWVCVEELKTKLKYLTSIQKSLISGAISGIVATIITMPFDVIKTNAQTRTKSTTNTIIIARKILDREGVKGFFKGLLPRLAKVGPSCAIMLSSYEAGKQYFTTSGV